MGVFVRLFCAATFLALSVVPALVAFAPAPFPGRSQSPNSLSISPTSAPET